MGQLFEARILIDAGHSSIVVGEVSKLLVATGEMLSYIIIQVLVATGRL